MKFILGKKLKMSQLFDEAGRLIPVTLIEAGPCVVVQVKTKDKDGYEAVVLSFDQKKLKNINKQQQGLFNKVKKENKDLKDLNAKWLREFKVEKIDDYRVGQIIEADVFAAGDCIKVSGLSKGRGFQGVVKRHGFRGGPATHGNKHSERAPGSIGCGFPERVWKGRRMAGRMGYDTVTISGLKVAEVDKTSNLIAIRGAVPGRYQTLLRIVG